MFDLRTISRTNLIKRLEEMQRQAPLRITNNRDNTITVDYDILTSAPVATDHRQGLAQLDRTLAQVVDGINQESRMANLTGATSLSAMFKDSLARIKAQLDQAGQEMTGAVTELTETANAATAVVKQVKAETAELKATLGQLTNFPPE